MRTPLRGACLFLAVACSTESPSPSEVDSAQYRGYSSPAGAFEQLDLLSGARTICTWTFRIVDVEDPPPPCADGDGVPCSVSVVGERVQGEDPLGHCWNYGFTSASAGDGGPIGVGWSDDYFTAAISQGPALVWWDGYAWTAVEPGESSWDPESGEFHWQLPAALDSVPATP